MKMAVGNLPQVVAEYFEAAILPAASRAGGASPFVAGLAGGLIARQAPAMVGQYLPMMQALGIVDAQGNLDIDLLYDEAVKSLAQHPLTIGGYSPNREDLDKIKAIMEKHGG